MESLEFVEDTTLSDKGINEVVDSERSTSVDRIVELEEDITDERERRLGC